MIGLVQVWNLGGTIVMNVTNGLLLRQALSSLTGAVGRDPLALQ